MLFGVEVLCRFSYNCFYDVNCINVSFSGFITSVREERESNQLLVLSSFRASSWCLG